WVCAFFLNPPRIAGISAAAPVAACVSLIPSSRAIDCSPPIWARTSVICIGLLRPYGFWSLCFAEGSGPPAGGPLDEGRTPLRRRRPGLAPAPGHDEREVVVLFVGAEGADLVHEAGQEGLRRAV